MRRSSPHPLPVTVARRRLTGRREKVSERGRVDDRVDPSAHARAVQAQPAAAGGSAAADLDACFRLVEETSRATTSARRGGGGRPTSAARCSSTSCATCWSAGRPTGAVRGFTSLLPTYEEGQPVVYCYEIHLKPDLQG